MFNYLTLFKVATPFVYLFGLMLFPINLSKSAGTLLGALIGLAVDLLSGTAGIHMAATTLAGFLRPYFLNPLIDAHTNTALTPSGKLLKKGLYLMLLLWIGIHHTALLLLDSLSAFAIGFFFLRLIGSILLSFLILLLLQVFFLDTTPKEN